MVVVHTVVIVASPAAAQALHGVTHKSIERSTAVLSHVRKEKEMPLARRGSLEKISLQMVATMASAAAGLAKHLRKAAQGTERRAAALRKIFRTLVYVVIAIIRLRPRLSASEIAALKALYDASGGISSSTQLVLLIQSAGIHGGDDVVAHALAEMKYRDGFLMSFVQYRHVFECCKRDMLSQQQRNDDTLNAFLALGGNERTVEVDKMAAAIAEFGLTVDVQALSTPVAVAAAPPVASPTTITAGKSSAASPTTKPQRTVTFDAFSTFVESGTHSTSETSMARGRTPSPQPKKRSALADRAPPPPLNGRTPADNRGDDDDDDGWVETTSPWWQPAATPPLGLNVVDLALQPSASQHNPSSSSPLTASFSPKTAAVARHGTLSNFLETVGSNSSGNLDGGMPSAVSGWVSNASIPSIHVAIGSSVLSSAAAPLGTPGSANRRGENSKSGVEHDVQHSAAPSARDSSTAAPLVPPPSGSEAAAAAKAPFETLPRHSGTAVDPQTTTAAQVPIAAEAVHTKAIAWDAQHSVGYERPRSAQLSTDHGQGHHHTSCYVSTPETWREFLQRNQDDSVRRRNARISSAPARRGFHVPSLSGQCFNPPPELCHWREAKIERELLRRSPQLAAAADTAEENVQMAANSSARHRPPFDLRPSSAASSVGLRAKPIGQPIHLVRQLKSAKSRPPTALTLADGASMEVSQLHVLMHRWTTGGIAAGSAVKSL